MGSFEQFKRKTHFNSLKQLVDRDAPLVAGITLALALRVEPMVLLVRHHRAALATPG